LWSYTFIPSTTIGPTAQAADDDDYNDDECAVVGGMRIERGHRNTRRKPVSVPINPQIPPELTWDES
jgi:hypothetical protein